MPTPPQPNTATVEPDFTLAVLIAAPTPVVTPQPISAAAESGTSFETGTTLIAGHTTYSAMLPSEQNAASFLSPRCKRLVPSIIKPPRGVALHKNASWRAQ